MAGKSPPPLKKTHPPADGHGVRKAALFLTLLTGFSGLVYQVAWQQYLATLLGSHSEATCAVLGIFLGGLSVGYALFGRVARWLVARAGADRRAGLLQAYGLVESGIGLYALAFPWLFGVAQSVSLSLPQRPELLAFAFDVALTALLIGPPTVLMGGTIPLLTQGLSRGVEDSTRFHSLVYGVNTAGAFFGALAAGFVLVPVLGLVGSVVSMGCVNLAAGLAFLSMRGQEAATRAPMGEAASTKRPRGLAAYAVVALLAGFAMMTLQVALNRVGALALGASHFTFAMVVATFVLSIALGSFAVAALERIPRSLLAGSQWALVACLLLAYPVIADAPFYAHVLRVALDGVSPHTFYAAVFACLLLLALVPLGLSGALLPLLFHQLRRDQTDLGDTAGRLYAWNTAGSLLGALVGGYLLLFWVDLHVTWRLAALALALSASLLSWLAGRTALAASGFAVAALALAALPEWPAERLNAGLFRAPLAAEPLAQGPDAYFAELRERWGGAERLLFHRDDPAASVAVVRSRAAAGGTGLSIVTNGKSDGNTPGDDATMVLASLLPALLAERCERAFVIGWGTGISVGELAALEATREVVVAEISPGVMQAAPLFAEHNRNALANPKTRVQRSDAYRALLRSEGRFDVIVSEPSNPWTTGVEMLFSLEFLQAARARLSEGGVYAQWFHTYETDAETIALVLRTYREAFDHVAVWRAKATDLLILGFADARHIPDLAELEARFARKDTRAQLARIGITDLPQLLAHEVLPLGVVHAMDLPGRLHTILHPVLSHVAARAFYRREVGVLPAGLPRAAAEAGIENSWLRRWIVARGLSDAERLGVVESVCRLDLSHCATLFAAWGRSAPASQVREAALHRARQDTELVAALSPEALARLSALYGPDSTAGMAPSYELASDLSAIYRKYYHHAAPFAASSLHAAWERCAENDPRCAEKLPQVRGLGLPAPLYSRR